MFDDATPLTTPVALIIFNRPDTTRLVLDAIARARPSRLFVIADGPRADKVGEAELCAAARSLIDQVDWPCEIATDYSDVNLGCGRRVSSGLTWVFEHVDEAIILEDDCVPEPTFFGFCQELLQRYRHDDRVSMISGNNFQFGRRRTDHSYYFSRYHHIWGWATWKRAWRHFDFDMGMWPQARDQGWLKDILVDPRAVRERTRVLDELMTNLERGSWAYRWTLACWLQSMSCVLPNRNLVTNVGFGPEATHTTDLRSPLSRVRTEPMEFPLSHPPILVQDRRADDRTFELMSPAPAPLPVRAARKVLRTLRRGDLGSLLGRR